MFNSLIASAQKKRGLTGGIPSLCERKSRWDLRKRSRWESAASSESLQNCDPLNSREGAFFWLCSLRPSQRSSSLLNPFFPLCDTLLLHCNSAGSGLNFQQWNPSSLQANTQDTHTHTLRTFLSVFLALYISTYYTIRHDQTFLSWSISRNHMINWLFNSGVTTFTTVTTSKLHFAF